MKDKTKRTLLIAVGALLSVALIVGIASRFGGAPQTVDPELNHSEQNAPDPIVDIDESRPSDTPVVNVNIDASGDTGREDEKPGAGADSTGAEQTIQANPVKPEAPEPPAPIENDHGRDDVPEDERNTEIPPTYAPEQTVVTPPTEPAPGSTNGNGQMYVPGFGYVEVGGGNEGGTLDDMYESGEKVGIMD